jgi:VanZ family protein
MMRLIKKLLEFRHLLSICIVYSLLVTVLFLYPFKGIASVNFILPVDKLIHVLIYFSLSFLWISYYDRFAKYKKTRKSIIIIILLCFFYGIVIELIQEILIPFRGSDLFDVFANMIGTILGTLFFCNFNNRIKS